MSDTPRTEADRRDYPSPEYAQRIVFEGCDCVVMSPEEYESLYEHARQLERELAARVADVTRLSSERDVLRARIADVTADRDSWRDQAAQRMDDALVEIDKCEKLKERIAELERDVSLWRSQVHLREEVIDTKCRSATAERESMQARIDELERENEWRPIETAPKDGTDVLVCHANNNPFTAHWDSYYSNWINEVSIVYPTHWRPLPKPPTQKKENV